MEACHTLAPVVSAYPKGLVPDLRRLRTWRSLRNSLWRNPDLVRLTDPFGDERGALAYEVAEFPDAWGSRAPYDRVLFSRVLHHIVDPAAAVDRAAELIGHGGGVACVEFAHDRLGGAGARWMAQSRMALSRSGWWPERVAGSLEEEAGRVAREWRAEHEGEGLNTLRAMIDPLRAAFRIQRPAWYPYLFWDLAAEMRAPPDQEGALAGRLRDQEAALLRQRRLRGVLFSTTGSPRMVGSR